MLVYRRVRGVVKHPQTIGVVLLARSIAPSVTKEERVDALDADALKALVIGIDTYLANRPLSLHLTILTMLSITLLVFISLGFRT